MNTTAINILKGLAFGTNDAKSLMSEVGIKEWQFNSQIKDLSQSGYLTRENGTIRLQDNAKTTLIKKLASQFNIEKILRGSNEIVLSYLTEPVTVYEIVKKTDLSQSTVYRTISDFEELGIIKKANDKIAILDSQADLKTLAEILKTERTNQYEPNAEIIYQDPRKILKKVPRGKITDGQLTGFSLFTDYGIEYFPTFDYYVKQEEALDIQQVLMHAVYSAQRNRNKTEITMTIIFYLKHKEKMDVLELRKIAESFNIIRVWLDIEGYIRNTELRDPELFLPKEEFIEKADLYDISAEHYTLPEGFPKLFEEMGKYLPRLTRAFLIGGENMRVRGLKSRTKDIDLVVENKDDFDTILGTLTQMGYKQQGNIEFSREDLRIYPSAILQHPNRSRIDLYTKKILKSLSLSHSMVSRADLEDFGKLRLGILRNEDVFLLKAVTNREGDIQDMASLVRMNYSASGKYRQGDFDWDVVWTEIINQEEENKIQVFTEIIRDNIEWLSKQTGIIPPFKGKLQRYSLDQQIRKLLREGSIQLKEIVDLLMDDDNPESTIRNRVESFVKNNEVIKKTIKNEVHVIPVRIEPYPDRELDVNQDSLPIYLDWRFYNRPSVTHLKHERVAEELNSIGISKIKQLDDIIIKSLSTLKEYERYYSKKLSKVGAMRICIGLVKPKLGRSGTSVYYVSNFDKFNKMLENIDENELYRVTTEVSNTSTLETGDPNTSVFFENSHTETTTTWEDGFTSGDLVVDSAQYRDSSDSNWYTWDGQSEEKQCGGSPTTSELMSGSFTSGSVTWDLSNMRSKCDAP